MPSIFGKSGTHYVAMVTKSLRQDKTRQLYLTRVAQSAARLVSLGALGSIKLHIHIYNKITRGKKKKKRKNIR